MVLIEGLSGCHKQHAIISNGTPGWSATVADALLTGNSIFLHGQAEQLLPESQDVTAAVC